MKKPDIEGPAGRAWRFTATPEIMKEKPHGLDAYLIHQPNVHAVWSWWFVTGCDLYDDPDPTEYGRWPPKRDRPDMTHEFFCYALNPQSGHYAGSEPPDGWDSTEEEVETRVGRHWMTPPEFVHQDKLRDSDQANEILRLLVRAMCDGVTYADSDFATRNHELLAGTAEHFRQGKHDIS